MGAGTLNDSSLSSGLPMTTETMASAAHKNEAAHQAPAELHAVARRRVSGSGALLLCLASLPAVAMGFSAPSPGAGLRARSTATRVELRPGGARAANSLPATGLGRGGARTGGGACGSRMMLDPQVSNMLFGALAGSVSSVVLLPVDSAKTAVQMQTSGDGACDQGEEESQTEAMSNHWKSVIEKDGIAGLFKGFLPALAGGAPEAAIQFAVHDWAMATLTALFVAASAVHGTDPATVAQTVSLVSADSAAALEAAASAASSAGALMDTAVTMDVSAAKEIGGTFARENAGATLLANVGIVALPPAYAIHAMAGAWAGIFQVVATNPMEVLKQRAIMDKGASASVVAEVKELGLPGLFKGTTATWLRDVPFSALYFSVCAAVYGSLHSALGDGVVANSIATSVAGLSAGVFASFVTTPADVIKTRIQCGDVEGASIRDVALAIAREDGVAGFYKGVTARVLKIAPAMMINICVYQALKTLLLGA